MASIDNDTYTQDNITKMAPDTFPEGSRPMTVLDFKTVVSSSPEAIAILERSGVVVYSNHALDELVGFTANEIVGMNVLEFITEDSHEIIKNQLRLPAMDVGVQHRYILDLMAKSGKRMTCDIVTSTLKTDDGRDLITAFIRDLTGLKVLESRFTAEQRKYFDLVSESTSIVLVLNRDLVISLANRGFKESLKYPEGSVVGKDIRLLDIVDSHVIDAMQGIVASSEGEGRRGIESTAWTKDGLKMVVSWYLSAVKESDGSVSGVLAIGHDITSKFQLESLYHSMSMMLEIEHTISLLTSTSVDSHSMMKSALDHILRMYGHEEGFAMDLGSENGSAPLAIVGDRLAFEEINKWITGKIEDFYEPVYFPDDLMIEAVPFGGGLRSLGLLPLRGKGGVVGYICIGSEKEIALSQNQKDAMVGVISMLGYAYENIGLAESLRKSKEQLSLFNDILLHDISNYLVPMKAYLDLLKKREYGEAKGREYLDRIMISDDALNEFIKDVRVLMYAKNTKTDCLMSVPLMHEIKNSVDVSISRYNGGAVELIVPDGIGSVNVMADNALHHLFTNLVTNAMKHSMPRPVVIRVHDTIENGLVKITVEDEGPGIPDENKGLVFERGFSEPTGKVAKSTGIGLSIVSALIQKYHGKVSVEDRVPGSPSLGASFVVELRLAEL